MIDVASLRARLEKYNQSHLLHFWDKLSQDEREYLVNEIESIDVAKMARKFQLSIDSVKSSAAVHLDQLMEPPPHSIVSSARKSSAEKLEAYQKKAFEEISLGRVGVVLLAGGQGTRLGVPYPKGMYSVGLPSGKTLYQLQAERIRRLETLAERRTGVKASIPWYIMTSGHTRDSTVAFFKEHDYFGLVPEDVVMFDQGTAPCFDLTGRILLASESKLSKSPDGNGGLYASLKSSGSLDDMKRRGIRCIHVYGVDNVLVKVADPVFMGYCLHEKADCGAKVVPKAFPEEPVGVVCQVEGVYKVVEYSEITLATAEKRDESGELVFSAGNICNHFFTVEFLELVSSEENEDVLAYHPATKKIPCIDPDQGVFVKPAVPNGIKLEKFVFDVFAFAKNFRLWEVDRDEEFSPVKNADGAEKDTPTTARNMLFALNKKFIEKAGGKFLDAGGETEFAVEISPLTSYAGEDLEDLVKGEILGIPCIL